MSRRRRAEHRPTSPDIRYSSPLVTHLINVVMKCGKKSLSERIVYGAFERVSEKLQKGDPVDLLMGAMENARPKLEVKSRRVGGATYQVPLEVRPEERTTRSIKWLIRFARERSERTMAERLANELLAASRGEGGAMRQRDDVHRMAEANKAFAHYRF
jgi:small subunit ribosomal protein S7